MTVLQFTIIPTLVILLVKFDLFILFIVYIYLFYTLAYVLTRYVILIKNFNALFFKNMEKLNMKLILYGNLCSFIFYIYALTTSLNLFMLAILNFLLLLPEVVMTTIFNIPVLYRVTTFTVKNKYFKWILKLLLVIMLIINLYFIFNVDILYSRVLFPY